MSWPSCRGSVRNWVIRPWSRRPAKLWGAQAVSNVLFGRYKMISSQVKDYVYGLYGKSPAPIDPEIQKVVLKGYERGETPITSRPADILKPELDAAEEATRGIAKNIGDVLIYALYPTTGLRFLKWKYGLEKPPADTQPRTLEDIKKEDELCAKAKAGQLVEKGSQPAVKEIPPRKANVRTFKVYVENEVYDIGVEGRTVVSWPFNRWLRSPNLLHQPHLLHLRLNRLRPPRQNQPGRTKSLLRPPNRLKPGTRR